MFGTSPRATCLGKPCRRLLASFACSIRTFTRGGRSIVRFAARHRPLWLISCVSVRACCLFAIRWISLVTRPFCVFTCWDCRLGPCTDWSPLLRSPLLRVGWVARDGPYLAWCVPCPRARSGTSDGMGLLFPPGRQRLVCDWARLGSRRFYWQEYWSLPVMPPVHRPWAPPWVACSLPRLPPGHEADLPLLVVVRPSWIC